MKIETKLSQTTNAHWAELRLSSPQGD